ncbi:MAG TPA: hypothetical protein VGY66_21520 [Gemmataceae bacterium]|jgi:hypothetical protein|nr:hypothetical protein [Gemmataceae bacterium]
MQRLAKIRQFWPAILFVFVAMAVGYLLIPVRGSRIGKLTCDKIQVGWSKENVEALLGPQSYPPKGFDKFAEQRIAVWQNDDGDRIMVLFEQNRVVQKSFAESTASLEQRTECQIRWRLRRFLP